MSPPERQRMHDAASAVVTVEDFGWDANRHGFSFRRLLKFMGPGILMSIAYIDPGNLESDLQVGAQAGYVLLWLLLLSTTMGLVVQMQAAKLGVVTGQHLAQHCRQQYPTGPRTALWIMAEIAIIGSDVQEVIGSAIALALLSGGRLPLWAGVLLTAVDSFALLFIERLGIRVLEGFFAGMVGVMVIAFGVLYGRANVPTEEVVRGFTVPQLPRKDVPVAVALMGSLIMPHNIYLHSALVNTRKLGSNHPAAKREALCYFGIESALSLVVAVVINLCITAVFAAGFYGADVPGIGLQNAGWYLGNTYGEAVVIIWALGLLAAGQSSTMTGTYTGQFVMEGYLDLKVSPWARVAITRFVAIAPTLAVALLCGGSGGKGDGGGGVPLDQLNQALNLLQSIQLPFALMPVLTFTSSRAIMGQFANSVATSALCWAIAALVVAINMLAVYEVAAEAVAADPWVSGTAVGLAVTVYLALIGYLAVGPGSLLARWMGWSEDKPADVVLGQGVEGGVGGEVGRAVQVQVKGGAAACECCRGGGCGGTRAVVGGAEGPGVVKVAGDGVGEAVGVVGVSAEESGGGVKGDGGYGKAVVEEAGAGGREGGGRVAACRCGGKGKGKKQQQRGAVEGRRREGPVAVVGGGDRDGDLTAPLLQGEEGEGAAGRGDEQ